MNLYYGVAASAWQHRARARSLGIEGIIDGDRPESSVLYERVTRRDEQGMPPIGSTVVDTEGAALLADSSPRGSARASCPPRCATTATTTATAARTAPTATATPSSTATRTPTPARSPTRSPGPRRRSGSTAGAAANGAGTCGGGDARDHVIAFTPPSSGTYCADTLGSGYDTLLHVRTSCASSGSQIACNDDIDTSGGVYVSRVEFSASDTVYIFVDGYDGEGDYTLSIDAGACP